MKRHSKAAIIVLSLILILAINRLYSNPVTHMFEIHFQEGFDEDIIEVSGISGDTIVFTAQSKFTTGLAHIIELTEYSGTNVTIKIDDLDYTIDLNEKTPFVTVNKAKGVLEINQTEVRPGYL